MTKRRCTAREKEGSLVLHLSNAERKHSRFYDTVRANITGLATVMGEVFKSIPEFRISSPARPQTAEYADYDH